ncbi:MAG: 50S ribosomal protein L21 [Bacteroidetes bacterium]|nr:MAG: 50S ribosomal protein L21 [Bacteroidota bacterium]RLD95210.1 MAG: 50S ribosomal protein L21 [Bacteroidota bacterium]RLD97540.1 MAG: 50S ribosomal protein L21 [Bacteroidota bacterium]
MYAIVDIAGQQFKVEKDQKLYVHRLEVEEGKKVSFQKVLLIDTGNKVSVGNPVVKGASVDAKVISHMKGDKVLVFKKKRRKGYQKLNGHRQYMTQIQIEAISETGGATKKEAPAAKKEEAPAAKTTAKKPAASKAASKAAPKATAEKPAAAKKPAAKKPAAKTTAAKTTAAKKPAAKKPAAKKPAAKAAPKKESGDKAE